MPQLLEAAESLDAVDVYALTEYGSSAETYRNRAERSQQALEQGYEHKVKYWRDLQLTPTFERMKESLMRLGQLPPGWDSYSADPPNRDAQVSAWQVISALESRALPPTRVVASSEGGVAICFVKGNRYADIECLNSGEILAVMYEATNEPHAWEISGRGGELIGAIEQIRAHFTA